MDILSVEFSGGGGPKNSLADTVPDEGAISFPGLGYYSDVFPFLVDGLHRSGYLSACQLT